MRADGATRASARGVTAVRIGSGALLNEAADAAVGSGGME